MSAAITSVKGWQALDSRGRPTVACRVTLEDGATGHATVPSGASAGSHEAHELRDGGTSFAGRGVRRAVGHVNGQLADAVLGLDALAVGVVDAALEAADSSPGFAVVGANATLAISLAAALAAASSERVSLARHLGGPGELILPMPMVNVVSGGAHAGGVLDVQDFLVLPHGATSFSQAIEWSMAVREAAQEIALELGFGAAVLVADEGGLGISLDSNRAALDLLVGAITRAGLRPGVDAGIAIDVAANELYLDGRYHLKSEHRSLTPDELIDEIQRWCDDFPIVSVEDALAEDDWDGWARATTKLGERIELVGDDLFVTSEDRLIRGIDNSVANSVLVKVNQNGLVRRAEQVLQRAQSANYRTVVSARSGDTEDTWLADLAVGWRAGQIKVGSTHRSERTAKWNRLLELEATEKTTFAGPWPISDRTASPRHRKASA